MTGRGRSTRWRRRPGSADVSTGTGADVEVLRRRVVFAGRQRDRRVGGQRRTPQRFALGDARRLPSGGDAVLVGPAAVELEFVGVDDPRGVEAALPLVLVAGAPGGGVIVIAFIVGPAPFAVAAGGELDGEGELLLVVVGVLPVEGLVVVAVGRWPPERWRGGLVVVCRGGACRGR